MNFVEGWLRRNEDNVVTLSRMMGIEVKSLMAFIIGDISVSSQRYSTRLAKELTVNKTV